MNKIKQTFDSLMDHKLNILSFSSSKNFIKSISDCGHNFFLINNSGGNLDINDTKNLPENIHIMNNLHVFCRWNLCLITSRQSLELEYAHRIKSNTGIPICLFEKNPMRYYFPHIPPNQKIPKRLIGKIQNMKPDVEVFINEEVKDSWSNESTSHVLNNTQDISAFWNNIFQQIEEN